MKETKDIFEKDLSAERIIRDLSLLMGKQITLNNTLLFLDEIQEVPRAITALRYFYEQTPTLHIIAAGSLIDFAIDRIGVPVGRVTFLYQHPMSFLEFLVAVGESLLVEEILHHTVDTILQNAIHNKLLHLLGEYFAVGGMPEVVNEWVQTRDIARCVNIQRSLVDAYRQDFQKYTNKFQLNYVDLIFNNIPRLLGKSIKYTLFSKEYRKRELEPCLGLLLKANIAHKVEYSSGNGIPLAAESNPEKFKLIFLDIALAQTILGLDIKDWFLKPEVSLVNKGEVVEAFIGQELLAYAYPTKSPELYYWQREVRGSQAEIDYLATYSHHVIPIEVKSGEGRSLKSLRSFLSAHPQSPFGTRFSIHNYSVIDGVQSYPLYATAGIFGEDEEGLRSLIS